MTATAATEAIVVSSSKRRSSSSRNSRSRSGSESSGGGGGGGGGGRSRRRGLVVVLVTTAHYAGKVAWQDHVWCTSRLVRGIPCTVVVIIFSACFQFCRMVAVAVVQQNNHELLLSSADLHGHSDVSLSPSEVGE